jgi:hypothetical protein
MNKPIPEPILEVGQKVTIMVEKQIVTGYEKCPACDGTKRIVLAGQAYKCPACDGTGGKNINGTEKVPQEVICHRISYSDPPNWTNDSSWQYQLGGMTYNENRVVALMDEAKDAAIAKLHSLEPVCAG